MQELSFPIGKPSIEIKIDDIKGVTHYKWYRAKIVGMGGLTPAYFAPMSPMMMGGMVGGLLGGSDILATGLTTTDRIVEADAEKDYKLLAITDKLRHTLITVETLNKILSGERTIWQLIGDVVKEPSPGVEYRVVDYHSDKQNLYDLDNDGGRTHIDMVPFIIRKDWMNWMLDDSPTRGRMELIEAAWETLTGGDNGLATNGPFSDPYAIWKPTNAKKIREQIAAGGDTYRFSDWFHENDPFGIKELASATKTNAPAA